MRAGANWTVLTVSAVLLMLAWAGEAPADQSPRLMGHVRDGVSDRPRDRSNHRGVAALEPADATAPRAPTPTPGPRQRDPKAIAEGQQAPPPEAANLFADILAAAALLREGRVDEALSAALALTEQYPDSDASWALAGIARARLGDLDGAQDDLERALALHPGDPAAAGNLAAIALRQGRIDVARGYYMQVLFHQPGHEQTLHKLSRLEQKAGNDAAAEALLERAIDAHPRRLSAYLKLVSFYRERGRGEEAMLRLQRVQQHFDAEPQYWSVLALLQLSAGDARAAVGSLSRRVALAPDALGYLQLANARAAAADAAGFEAALLQALELRPNDPAAGHLVSYYLEQAADDAARAERIARVRSVAPDRPELVRAAPPSAMPVAPARPSAR